MLYLYVRPYPRGPWLLKDASRGFDAGRIACLRPQYAQVRVVRAARGERK